MFRFFERRRERGQQPALDLSLLQQRREALWRRLGQLREDHVVSRLVPGAYPWPSSALGKLRLIRRTNDVLLVTEGLSDPYDPELHPEPPAAPLDFELCFSIAAAEDEQIADGIWPKLLYALTDAMVEDWPDVRGLLQKFGSITYKAPIGGGFGHGYERDGLVGYLLGMPWDSDDFDRQLYLNGFYAGLPVPYADASIGIFPVKALRPSELDWAIAQGNDGGVQLAREFLARGEGHLNDEALPALH